MFDVWLAGGPLPGRARCPRTGSTGLGALLSRLSPREGSKFPVAELRKRRVGGLDSRRAEAAP